MNDAIKQTAHRISRKDTALLVVDLQERLLPVMFEKERVLQNSLRLVQGAKVLGIPVFVTEQYRKGLGPTVPEIAAALPTFAPFEKMAFSACGADKLDMALEAAKLPNILLCGIEAHVCVSQTCLDLLQQGFRVFVPADAVSSRTRENHQIGLGRMRDAGAFIVSTEMALLELLEKAGTPEFKQILELIK
jgi:nicotinamidase-related amidase